MHVYIAYIFIYIYRHATHCYTMLHTAIHDNTRVSPPLHNMGSLKLLVQTMMCTLHHDSTA